MGQDQNDALDEVLDVIDHRIRIAREHPLSFGSYQAAEVLLLVLLELRAAGLRLPTWSAREVVGRLTQYTDTIMGEQSVAPLTVRLQQTDREHEIQRHLSTFAELCLAEQGARDAVVTSEDAATVFGHEGDVFVTVVADPSSSEGDPPVMIEETPMPFRAAVAAVLDLFASHPEPRRAYFTQHVMDPDDLDLLEDGDPREDLLVDVVALVGRSKTATSVVLTTSANYLKWHQEVR